MNLEPNAPQPLSAFDFELPEELIAQTPLAQRSASRLLVTQPDGRLIDRTFTAILDQVTAKDCLVFNDTRVMKARLFGQKDSGGKVEVLVEKIVHPHCVKAHVRASHRPKMGQVLHFDAAMHATVTALLPQGLVQLESLHEWATILSHCGHLPLPPYITHRATAYDETRYQTVYGNAMGAVAAPTAGLHFDEALLTELTRRGIEKTFVTLHVGAGTFQPIRVDDLRQHQMHTESYVIPPETVTAIRTTKARGGRIIAVGTTSLRALESASNLAGELTTGAQDTALFIRPGYPFRCVDALITNFHLPKSSLLVLVSAFAGYDLIRRAYAHAIAQRYRFFSYGDAMWLNRG